MDHRMDTGYVGILTLRLEMPWVSNLKEKRALVRPVVERLKVRFPVTVARLDGLNAHDWELIGVSTISNDHEWVEQTLKMASDYVASGGEYRVTGEEQVISSLSDLLGYDDAEDDEEEHEEGPRQIGRPFQSRFSPRLRGRSRR